MCRSRPTPRPVRYAYAAPGRQKLLGALPVVSSLCRQLDLAGIIDRLCPVREVAIVSHGQVIEALVANRLTSPQPLVRVEEWAREWAVAEVFGIEAAALNDDRIGRALDAIAPEQERIAGTVGAQAIARFGLEVSRMHWDMTSISLYGAYEEPEPGFATPRWGKPKDRRPDLKQVQTGLAVTAQEGIPLWHRAYDGGAGEVSQVVGAMQALQELAGQQRLLLIGDSKLISRGNVMAMNQAGVKFIAPAGKSYVPAERLSVLDREAAIPVEYVAERDLGKPVETRASYRVLEGEVTLAGKRAGDPELRVRCVFVWASARAQAAAANRAKKLERARGDLGRLGRGLGGRYYPDVAAVKERLRAIGAQHNVAAYLRAEVGSKPAGKPTLTWQFDQDALDAEAASDGWYGLLANLEPAEADAAEVLVRYKGQESVERRYGNFKGPLAVAPLFLTSNRRIAALITVICLALLIFCLVERGVRRAIAPRLTLAGLYAGRPAKPTGRLVFDALVGLRLNPLSNAFTRTRWCLASGMSTTPEEAAAPPSGRAVHEACAARPGARPGVGVSGDRHRLAVLATRPGSGRRARGRQDHVISRHSGQLTVRPIVPSQIAGYCEWPIDQRQVGTQQTGGVLAKAAAQDHEAADLSSQDRLRY